MKLVLTGEVGAGKSSARHFFETLGWHTLSADDVVHQLWKDPHLQALAAQHWGDDLFIDCQLQRPLLAQRAFVDEENRTKLNSLIHPRVRAYTAQWVEDKSRAIVEIPLAFEAGLPLWCQGVVFLYAPDSLRQERNAYRMTAEDMEHREQGFLPRPWRMKQSDWVYENSGTLEDLRHFVETVSLEASILDELDQGRGLKVAQLREIRSEG